MIEIRNFSINYSERVELENLWQHEWSSLICTHACCVASLTQHCTPALLLPGVYHGCLSAESSSHWLRTWGQHSFWITILLILGGLSCACRVCDLNKTWGANPAAEKHVCGMSRGRHEDAARLRLLPSLSSHIELGSVSLLLLLNMGVFGQWCTAGMIPSYLGSHPSVTEGLHVPFANVLSWEQ